MYRTILILFFLILSAPASPAFLMLSDIHYGAQNISKDGQDTGPKFLKIMLSKFQTLSSTVDFIIFLGDIPTHGLLHISQKENYESLIFHDLYQKDTQSKPMFYIPGNNDSLEGDYQPFEWNGLSPLNFAKEWTGACIHCKKLIIDDSHMHHDGYYSSYVMPKNKSIILVALNTIQWARTPFFSRYPHQKKAALTQLKWLDEQLKQHHAKQLLIAMHIPPGNNYLNKPLWQEEYLQAFIKILEQHHHLYDQITLLSAHSHMDELRKIHLQDGSNIYAYSTPGISRDHHNYPGMKIFHLNRLFQIKNFTTYYTSFLNKWGNEQYSALGNFQAIFPQCQHTILAACLNQLSEQQICNNLDQGRFYGVKSPYVPNNACSKIYQVN
jgi:Calcineurin-like phosphoesterase